MTASEFDRLNALWMNGALSRGDKMLAATDPDMFAVGLNGQIWRSRMLSIEIPMSEEFGVPVRPAPPVPVSPINDINVQLHY
jgi:hypothetical protein